MSIRDLFIISIFGYFCVQAFKKPYIGALLLIVISYMSPHRLAPWTLSYSLPLYMIAFLVTVIGFVAQKDKDPFPRYNQIVFLVLFVVWGAICTIFAMEQERAMEEFTRSYKLLLGVILFLYLFQSEFKIKAMVWAISLSIAFYGVKGGVFTLMTGAQFRVWGPPGTYIEGNNELAMGILVIIPLMFFLFTEIKNNWFKLAMAGSIGLCFISVVGSQSRGALVGLIMTSAFLWWKSKMKIPLAILGLIGVISFIPFIPDTWWDRMETIKTYQEDGSAMGRINAWTTAINIANDRVTGGGYRFWGARSFAIYAPVPEKVHDAHSIYFEVLGETGWPGFILYTLLLFGWWRVASANAKLARGVDSLKWCVTLSKMSQVSQVAYMSAGAFLGLAYWNLPYDLMVMMILVNVHIKKQLSLISKGEVSSAPA